VASQEALPPNHNDESLLLVSSADEDAEVVAPFALHRVTPAVDDPGQIQPHTANSGERSCNIVRAML
jgi:hypothetical protein